MTHITVKNVARRPVDLTGGRVLAHGEQAAASDDDRTRAQIEAGLLVPLDEPSAPAEEPTEGGAS